MFAHALIISAFSVVVFIAFFFIFKYSCLKFGHHDKSDVQIVEACKQISKPKKLKIILDDSLKECNHDDTCIVYKKFIKILNALNDKQNIEFKTSKLTKKKKKKKTYYNFN